MKNALPYETLFRGEGGRYDELSRYLALRILLPILSA